MKVSEFKAGIKKFPEAAWLSQNIKDLKESEKYDEFIPYLTGEKDITNVNSAEELYKIKGSIFLFKMKCQMTIDLIDELGLGDVGGFEDITSSLEDIGLKKGDQFICIKNFLYMDSLPIDVGSVISIFDYQNMGANSKIFAKFEKLLTEESKSSLSSINLVFGLKDIDGYFKKI